MDTPKSSQQSSLDSLRTVEFRQTLRGYHIDDVDEYLERVAVEAEALQEQLRRTNERAHQAAERIAELERLLAERREQAAPAEREAAPAVSDDTLQRTLLLAQKFVDQTKTEAEAQARTTVSKAEEQARGILAEAEAKARSITQDTERQLREEVGRLETLRTQLAQDVENIAGHLEDERNRMRSSLVEMIEWVDKNVQPASVVLVQKDAQKEQREDRSSGSPQLPQSPLSGNGPGMQGSGTDLQRLPSAEPAVGGR